MSDRSPLDDERLWLAAAVGAFSATAWVYVEFGFVQSFAPLFVGIFALRRYLGLMTAKAGAEAGNAPEAPTVFERYGVDPDREYSEEEAAEILSDVRDEYGRKRLLWVVVAAAAAVVGALFVSLSIAVALVCVAVAAYSAHRAYRTHRLVARIDGRLAGLGNH